MKIDYEEEALELCTEDVLERFYLERLGLKNEGDVAKCVVVFTDSYVAIHIVKAEKGSLKGDDIEEVEANTNEKRK